MIDLMLLIGITIILVIGTLYMLQLNKDIQYRILIIMGSVFIILGFAFNDFTKMFFRVFILWQLVVFLIFYIKTWLKRKLKIVTWLPVSIWGMWGVYAGFRIYLYLELLKMDLPVDEVGETRIFLIAFVLAFLVSAIYIIVKNTQNLKDKQWIKILACGITVAINQVIIWESIFAEGISVWHGVDVAVFSILMIVVDMSPVKVNNCTG